MSSVPTKLWLIDDDATEHLIVKRALKRIPFANELRTFEAASPAMKALESITKKEDLPRVILCDVKMPCMDGFEFLQWLRLSPWKTLPVALFSNSEIQRDVTRAYELGANAYHVKSPTNDKLEHCLQVIVQFWGEVSCFPTVLPPADE